MGASQSVSHFAHRDRGRRHRLMRVDSNEEAHPCGMCSIAGHPGRGAEVYRCRCCTFVLHADCYSHREEIHDHFAHALPGHTLVLAIIHHHQLETRQQCNICAAEFNNGGGGGGRPSYFIYGCRQCHGFYAHPRCAALPPTLDTPLHPRHSLTLLPPPYWPGHGRLNCINAAAGARPPTNNDRSYSYQCNTCRVELCVECQLPQPNGGAAVHQRNGEGHSVGSVLSAHHVGTTVGAFFYAMGCACLGAPQPSAARQ